MNQLSPSEILALDYYTLAQAANELNRHFDRIDIDDSYLIHLAAAGKIQLVLPAFQEPLIAFPKQNDPKEQAILQYIVSRNTHLIFITLRSYEAARLSSNNEITISEFSEFYIYNPWNAYGTNEPFPLYPEQVKYFFEEKIIIKNPNLFLSEVDVFMSDYLFAFSAKAYSGLYYDALDGDRFSVRKNIQITKHKLMLLNSELSRIKNGTYRTLGKADLVVQLERKDESKKVRFKPEILKALKDLGYSDPCALPSAKNSGVNGVRNKVFMHLREQQSDLSENRETFKKYWQNLRSDDVIRFV